MFKKVHKSSSKVLCSKKNPSYCSVCKSSSHPNTLYVCETGHLICEICQCAGNPTMNRPDSCSGDFIAGKSLPPTPSEKPLRHYKTSSMTTTQAKDLASGDHHKCSKNSKLKRVAKSESKIKTDDSKDSHCTLCNKNKKTNPKPSGELETIIEYKNVNFCANKSSSSSLSSNDSIEIVKIPNNLPKNCKVCPRPVKCPILDCGKMIAMDSVMLHFCFDHSKVPRKSLISGTSSNIKVKPCNISMKTQCLAVFIVQNDEEKAIQKSDSGDPANNPYADSNAILLMAARMRCVEGMTKCKSLTNVSTQTNIAQNNLFSKKKARDFANVKVEVENKEVSFKEKFEINEMLLLWLCKLDDAANNCPNAYSISILRNDKKLGHSYIGEAIHIRDQQSPIVRFHNCDCLIVHGVAANRLLDEDNRFKVLINIID